MVDNKILQSIITKIDKAEWISPCLFLGKNTELVNSQVTSLAQELLQCYNIPLTYIYRLDNSDEKIKIAEIKNFVQPGNSLPGYAIQIFLIENISRLTLQSSNSCLKFFEEPGKHNVIFLTNNSESWILDTILSRVQTYQLWGKTTKQENPFFQSLLKDISNKKPDQALNYFYKAKTDKEEYLNFLWNIILFAKKNFIFLDKVAEIESDMQWIKQNNVNAKYIVDKYLLTL
jgi:DNA polymerase III gamma/tau subunit